MSLNFGQRMWNYFKYNSVARWVVGGCLVALAAGAWGLWTTVGWMWVVSWFLTCAGSFLLGMVYLFVEMTGDGL